MGNEPVLNRGTLVRNFVNWRMHRWESAENSPKTRGELALLRRGIGRAPGEVPELWGLLFDGCPEELMSRTGEPTRAEWAVSIALGMYALHQQGRDPGVESMNREGMPLGKAVRLLAPLPDDDDLERIRRRFNVFATSADIDECSHHLRSLVQMLRAANIKLDYPQLACDLYYFQSAEGAKRVKLKWGQDFYTFAKNGDGGTEDKEETDGADGSGEDVAAGE